MTYMVIALLILVVAYWLVEHVAHAGVPSHLPPDEEAPRTMRIKCANCGYYFYGWRAWFIGRCYCRAVGS